MSLALTLVPLLTAGQLGTITLNVNQQTRVAVNASQCGATITGTFTTVNLPIVCSDLQLWVTSGECADAPVAGVDLILDPVLQSTLQIPANRSTFTDMRQIAVADLPAFKNASLDGGAVCGTEGVDIVHKWCAGLKTTSFDVNCPTTSVSVLHAVMPVTIEYDTQPPAQPSMTAEPLDSAASLTFSVDTSQTDSIEVQDRVAGTGDFTKVNTLAGTTTSTTVPNLVNGTTYEFRIVAFDAAGNESDPSDPVSVTPRESKGFWGACRDAGCPPQGCSATGAGLGLIALAALWVSRRSRR
jgi:hypothetical protein